MNIREFKNDTIVLELRDGKPITIRECESSLFNGLVLGIPQSNFKQPVKVGLRKDITSGDLEVSTTYEVFVGFNEDPKKADLR